jgi:REP element-mobilizing transposase RayT
VLLFFTIIPEISGDSNPFLFPHYLYIHKLFPHNFLNFMSSKYKFRDQNKLYFVTSSIVYWLDVFIRNEYKDVVLDSLKYCQEKKGLEVYSWCIVTSHIHMIIGTSGKNLQDIMRDFKSFTSGTIKDTIKNNQQESRREWLIWMMERAGKQNNHTNGFQFWQEGNHPEELTSNEMMDQKLEYIHMNPVKAGFVDEPENYLYSSARDYSGRKGLLDIKFIE